MKFWQRIMLFSAMFLFSTLMSCAELEKTHKPQDNDSGKTPGQAISIKPATHTKHTQQFRLTVYDNIRWFYTPASVGKQYVLETVGTGNTSIQVYKPSQVKPGGDYNGAPIVQNNDGAGNRQNTRLTFKPSSTGGYYIMIILYAGSEWNGSLAYQVQ